MSDSAFKTGAYPGYSIEELRERVSAYEFWELSPDKVDAMRREIARREAVAAGDVSQMTAGERLRYARANPTVDFRMA